MTKSDKLSNIKILLEVNDDSMDTLLETYIDLSTNEILAWLYQMKGGIPTDVTEVPAVYEVVQIYSVVAGFSQRGAEGEKVHNENGINRTFNYTDMIDYIHAHVYPYVGV